MGMGGGRGIVGTTPSVLPNGLLLNKFFRSMWKMESRLCRIQSMGGEADLDEVEEAEKKRVYEAFEKADTRDSTNDAVINNVVIPCVGDVGTRRKNSWTGCTK